MSDTNIIKRNARRWIFVTRLLMILGLLCFLYSGSLYYSLFWTEAKVNASRELSFAGISCWIGALVIIARLGLFKWRR
jgi:hypothetical protein